MSELEVNTIIPESGDDISLNGQFTKLYTTGGTANAQTITLSPAPTALSDITRFSAKIVAANTGAMTIAPNGLAATDVKLADGNDPYAGAVNTTGVFDFVYDGTNLVLLNPAPVGNFLTATSSPTAFVGSEQTVTAGAYHTIFDRAEETYLLGGSIYSTNLGYRLTVDGVVVANYTDLSFGDDSAGNPFSVVSLPQAYGASSMKLELYNASVSDRDVGWRVLVK